MRKRRSLFLLALAFAGCAPAPDRGASAGLPADTIRAEPLTLIGELDGEPEYLFGDIVSVSMGPADVLYVADRNGATVRAYDPEGRYLGTIGSEGDGPGEFRLPNDITFDPAGRLYVRQRYRVTVFGPGGGGGQLRDSVLYTIPLERPALELARARATGDRYYSPSYYYFAFVRHRYFYEVLDSTGATGDTIPVPGIPNPEILGRANYPVGDGQVGVPVEGVNMAPFEPKPVWDITPDGRTLMTMGGRYNVFELGPAGDTIRLIDAATEPGRVPADELNDSTRAFLGRLDSIPVPLNQMRAMSDLARNRALPNALPEITGLQVAASGNIWIRRWPSGDQTYLDVFDVRGEPLRTVTVPAPLSSDVPLFVSETHIVGVVRDAVGVQRVAAFTLTH